MKRVHEFWFVSVDPFVLGAFRICLGLFCLGLFGALGPSWMEFYGPGGISPFPAQPLSGFTLFDPLLYYVTTTRGMWIFYGLSMAASVGLIAGVYTRPATVWLWLSAVSLIFRNPYVTNGEEQVLVILLFFSMFLPLDSSLTWRQIADPAARPRILLDDRTVPAWALRPLQIQLMLIYVVSFPAKLISDPAWLDGTAVYYSMMEAGYPRWPGLDLFAWGNGFVSRVLTYSTLLVEGLGPFLIWFERFRVACLLAFVALHVGMGLFLSGVAAFNAALLVGLVLFIPGRSCREWLRDPLSEK